jgi:hypothetical protein
MSEGKVLACAAVVQEWSDWGSQKGRFFPVFYLFVFLFCRLSSLSVGIGGPTTFPFVRVTSRIVPYVGQ